MRHFVCRFNESGKTLHEVLAVADVISPPIAGPRVDHGQRHGIRTVKISHKVLPDPRQVTRVNADTQVTTS